MEGNVERIIVSPNSWNKMVRDHRPLHYRHWRYYCYPCLTSSWGAEQYRMPECCAKWDLLCNTLWFITHNATLIRELQEYCIMRFCRWACKRRTWWAKIRKSMPRFEYLSTTAGESVRHILGRKNTETAGSLVLENCPSKFDPDRFVECRGAKMNGYDGPLIDLLHANMRDAH